MSETTIEQRTEWLSDFDDARYQARATLSRMQVLSGILYEAGNERLGKKIGAYADNLTEAIETMNASVSRMIHEDAQASWDQIGLTFKALLETCATSTKET